MTVQQITGNIDFTRIERAIPEGDVDRAILKERVERLLEAQETEYEQAAVLLTLIGVTAKRWADTRERAKVDAARAIAWRHAVELATKKTEAMS